MKASRLILALCLSTAMCAIWPAPAAAQPPDFTPMQLHYDPPLSPYLGLLNPNNSIGFNYYEIYRPQVRFRHAYREFNHEVGQLRRNVREFQQTEAPEYEQYDLGPTGHPTMFMNTRGYFPGLR